MSEPLLRAMRHALLERLKLAGARTLAELVQVPPMLLMLQLDEAELRVALDSCRRHRLVEPLDPAVRELDRAEWGLTDLGRKTARSPVGDALDRVAQLGALVVVVTGLLIGLVGAATGLDLALDTLDPTAAIALIVLVILTAQLMVAVANDRRHRVSRAGIAHDWERLARERPLMHRLHTRKRYVLWPGIVASEIALVIAILSPDPSPGILAAYVVFFGFFLVTQVLLYRLTRASWQEALDAMKVQIEALERSAATPPEPPAPRRASSPA
jgi:hypothetical protein